MTTLKTGDERVVIVTGGSRGLGLEIGRAFGEAGAQVVLMARDVAQLEEATQQLVDAGIRATYQVMDATQDDSVKTAFGEIFASHGGVDVLVNNIGKSTRSDIRVVDIEETRHLMEINLFTAMRCTREALASLVDRGGSVINIGSLASKTAWPFMMPYSTSKFALDAFTQQLRIELAGQIHAMLVCPGPIRRSDAGERYRDQAAGLGAAAQAPGGGAKLNGICPVKLAHKIVAACERRRSELIVPWKANLLFVAARISTRLGDWLLRLNRKPKS